MNKIPPVDLTRQYKLISTETETAVLDILSSGYYIGGSVVSDFEKQFAEYIGVKECISCNSGTDALYLALRALNIGKGDEVITSTFTFIATAEAITLTGAKPILVDIDLDTFNIDVNIIEKAITPQTKAIIPVHLFGQPVNMTKIMEIAEKYNLFVVEDCAQATGAEWDGKKVGNTGHIGCFSFFPTKNLGGCGDGGAITLNDASLAASLRMIKEHGSQTRYIHEVVGVNSRLDAIQAAILQVKLRYLEDWNQQRIALAQSYQELLSPISRGGVTPPRGGVTPPRGGVTPPRGGVTPPLLPSAIDGGKHVWNQYTIRVRDQDPAMKPLRDKVREKLMEKGVISMVYYPIPLHLQPVYQDLGHKKGQLPVSEQACREVLSLPMFPGLSFEEQQQVVYALKDSLG